MWLERINCLYEHKDGVTYTFHLHSLDIDCNRQPISTWLLPQSGMLGANEHKDGGTYTFHIYTLDIDCNRQPIWTWILPHFGMLGVDEHKDGGTYTFHLHFPDIDCNRQPTWTWILPQLGMLGADAFTCRGMTSHIHCLVSNYRNTIAGSPLGERIFKKKKRFASQKLNFSIFVF
jgi:hypothetical protein